MTFMNLVHNKKKTVLAV